MQWLIDIIQAWVTEQGYLTTGFVDRGDPSSSDWDMGTLSLDGNWHELDLSEIIDENAKCVLIRVQLRASALEKYIIFRKKGHTNAFNRAEVRTSVANLWLIQDIHVAVDENRKIEYMANDGYITGLWVTVGGWWL